MIALSTGNIQHPFTVHATSRPSGYRPDPLELILLTALCLLPIPAPDGRVQKDLELLFAVCLMEFLMFLVSTDDSRDSLTSYGEVGVSGNGYGNGKQRR